MNIIPTAAEIVEAKIDSGISVPDLMIEFAKLHVQAALVEARNSCSKVAIQLNSYFPDVYDSAINSSYPLTKIK